MLTRDDLHALLPRLEEFHHRFGRFFPRSQSRAWSPKYLVGLALPIGRKNVENIAEQVGGSPRRLQEFVSDSPWDDEGCVEELQRLVGEQLGASDGVLILDGHGVPEEGDLVGRGGAPVLGNPGPGGQLPGRRLPGLCERPRPHAGRAAAVHAGVLVPADRYGGGAAGARDGA